MAKMFYTIEEAAEHLGVDQEKVKQMAAGGQLQQFRDKDKLMFKRDQVDALANSGSSGAGVEAADSHAPIDLADTNAVTTMGATAVGDTSIESISLADSGDTDAVDLSAEDTHAGQTQGASRIATGDESGISVFETGEMEAADSMAQTHVTQKRVDDDDLALESVGSGSGLLDLTRESDDTSLGAELLDEIYPGGEASDAKTASAVGSSGVFESALGLETGQSAPSGLTHLGEAAALPAGEAAIAVAAAPTYSAEDGDPAWSGASAGMLLTATIAIVIALIVTIAALAGSASNINQSLAGFGPLYVLGALIILAIILGGIGFTIGKAAR